ncbi:hypothetical protein SDC9_197315 [bioreactor metagenome]|uniref:Uncharacterized protein n=1 Tax=bioreactor metagenome TaxID=1076179 RepID=A0A645IQZ5_9ZZZZ
MVFCHPLAVQLERIGRVFVTERGGDVLAAKQHMPFVVDGADHAEIVVVEHLDCCSHDWLLPESQSQ